MQKDKRTMKGQLNLVNIIGIMFAFLLYFFAFLPFYTPMANAAIAGLDPTWTTYPMTVAVIYLVPLLMIIAVVLYGFSLIQGQQQYAYG